MEGNSSHNHLANPAILPVTPYQPGKSVSAIKKQFCLREVVKLASNENLAGPSPLALKALEAVLPEINYYPDDGGAELKEALACKHDVALDNLVLGHGATDILEMIVRAFICPGDEIISAHPSFPWFQILGQLSGASNVVVPLCNQKHDLQGMLAGITSRTKLIFIANPNNPTGTYLARAEIENFLKAVPGNVMVVLDEAYIDYVTKEEVIPVRRLSSRPVLVVKTFSKISGIAGLRIGYAMAQRGIIELLEKARQPFNTTMLAHVAALASLEDQEHLEKSRQMAIVGKTFFYEEFRRLGIDFVPTETNFIFVDFHRDVKPIFEKLLERGFIIRPMLETCARITIGSSSQNAGLVGALRQVLKGTSRSG